MRETRGDALIILFFFLSFSHFRYAFGLISKVPTYISYGRQVLMSRDSAETLLQYLQQHLYLLVNTLVSTYTVDITATSARH